MTSTLAVTVASALLTAVSTDDAMRILATSYRSDGISATAMRASLSIVMSFPPDQGGFYGPAGRNMARANLLRRAQFAVSAAQRLSQDVSRANSARQSVAAALDRGVTRERRFYAAHLMAIWGRQKAGAQADSAAMDHGDLLGWYTVRDKKTSAECKQADGRNFYVDHEPLIGYPGAVHPNCRCYPGEPFPDGAILPSHGLTLRRAA
jgi:hypothetical protein